jgi:CheY-like chemotaxis protein
MPAATLTAARLIRARHNKGAAPRIVALIGDGERLLAAGMDEYLSKPIQVPTLIAALGRNDPWA